jgi:hypothetical protein
MREPLDVIGVVATHGDLGCLGSVGQLRSPGHTHDPKAFNGQGRHEMLCNYLCHLKRPGARYAPTAGPQSGAEDGF